MDDKKKRIMKRSSSIDEYGENIDLTCQQIPPIPTGYLPSPMIMPTKQHRTSTINERFQSFSHNQRLAYDQNMIPTATTTVSQKRARQDDAFTQEYHPYVNKRFRFEPTTSIELENQPPRATIQHRSLFLCHPRLDTNNLQQAENDLSSSASPRFNPSIPSLINYHQLNTASNHDYQRNLSNHYPSSHLHTEHLCIFGSNTLMNPNQKSTQSKSSMNSTNNNSCLLCSQSHATSPLRTTNFILENKQATIIRTGNISPAHSDTSIESTSTCSSDEQQFHYNSYHQPSRSYRERENYEQLLDLAEKLSDPDRYKKVDIEQFLSYHYKTITTTAELRLSKQTACVICMSHFKNGQNIRVLPCQHEYHSKCIARWFTMNSSCPICRRDNFLTTC